MLNKKGTSLLTLFILSSMISSLMLQNTVPIVYGQTDTEQDFLGDNALLINSDWLQTEPVSFNGIDIGDDRKYERLSIDHGGQGMQEFINHGEVAYDEDEDIHVYMATMTFLESYVIYTDVMIDDAYDHYTGTSNREWLKLKTFRTWFLGYYRDDIEYEEYDLSYSNIHINNMDPHEYDGNLQISAIVTPNLAVQEGGYMTIEGQEFYIPDIQIYISESKLVDRTYGVCDDPQNFYTENDNVIEVRKENLEDLAIHGESDNDAEDATGDGRYKDWTNVGSTPDEMINWAGMHDIRRTYGVTYTSGVIGQAFASTPTIGSIWDQPEDLNDADDVFDFNVPVRIKPNIFYDKEDFDINHAYLYVDRFKEWFLPEWGLCDVKEVYTESRDRIIGLGVQNIFAMMDFEFEVTMLMAVVPTGEEGVEVLEDPEIEQGDIIWDNALGGVTDARSPVSQPDNWWTELLDNLGDFPDILDWLQDGMAGLLDGWDDWWDDWLTSLTNWWQKYWWIIAAIALVIIVILGAYLLGPSILRKKGTKYVNHRIPYTGNINSNYTHR